MPARKAYRKRPQYDVTAVQLDLDFDQWQHQKWGHRQVCRSGDWLINNNDDVYTVDKAYFRDHYQRISVGRYKKIGEVWAEVAASDGEISTIEGSTRYHAGDYLVFDREQKGQGYAIKKIVFERMYEEVQQTLHLTTEQQHYIDQRIIPKLECFKKTATKNQQRYYFWQTTAIILAAFVPVLSGFITTDPATMYLKWLVALSGGASAVIVGLLGLFKYQENWLRYQSIYQDLDANLSQFHVGTGIYANRHAAFHLLAENCESILKAEVGQRAESRKDESKDTATDRQ